MLAVPSAPSPNTIATRGDYPWWGLPTVTYPSNLITIPSAAFVSDTLTDTSFESDGPTVSRSLGLGALKAGRAI